MKNMYMHLTNFTLNKNNENYVPCDENFLDDGEDKGSKRLLSTIWKTLEEEGYETDTINQNIQDCIRKCIITLEPYLKHYYSQNINKKLSVVKNLIIWLYILFIFLC